MCFSGKALALVDFPYGNGKKKTVRMNRCIQYMQYKTWFEQFDFRASEKIYENIYVIFTQTSNYPKPSSKTYYNYKIY